MHRYETIKRRPLTAYQLLFPLASLFAATVVPLWLVYCSTGAAPVDAAWHGHEMLFGYALAVIAGFLATHKSAAVVWILTLTWIAARMAAVYGSGLPAMIAGLSFPAVVLMITVPPLYSAAKRSENRIIPLLLTSLVATDVLWWAGFASSNIRLQNAALLAAIDLVTLLLLLVGGRALRAAAGGHVELQGIERRDRGQRRYELPLAALMGTAVVLDAFDLHQPAGICCIGAALLTLLRVLPWQLQHSLSLPSLWPLALGYLWLVPGLAVKGIAQLSGYLPVADALHGIGIGALGTLTLVMMTRITLLRKRKPIGNLHDIGAAAGLLSIAALTRLIAPHVPAVQPALLWLAAVTWSAAFLILSQRLWRAMG